MSFPPLAQAKGIDVHRGTSKVLEGASVSLGAGEVVSVMGENGSGYTHGMDAWWAGA